MPGSTITQAGNYSLFIDTGFNVNTFILDDFLKGVLDPPVSRIPEIFVENVGQCAQFRQACYFNFELVRQLAYQFEFEPIELF